MPDHHPPPAPQSAEPLLLLLAAAVLVIILVIALTADPPRRIDSTPHPYRTAQPDPDLDCGNCAAMRDCDHAYECLRAGHARLDRDGDGIPCESICPP